MMNLNTCLYLLTYKPVKPESDVFFNYEESTIVELIAARHSIDLSVYEHLLPVDLNKKTWSNEQIATLRRYEAIGDKFLDVYALMSLSPYFDVIGDYSVYKDDLVCNKNFSVLCVKLGWSAFFYTTRDKDPYGDYADLFETIMGMIVEQLNYDIAAFNSLVATMGIYVYAGKGDDISNNPLLNMIQACSGNNSKLFYYNKRIYYCNNDVRTSVGVVIKPIVKIKPLSRVVNAQNTLFSAMGYVQKKTYVAQGDSKCDNMKRNVNFAKVGNQLKPLNKLVSGSGTTPVYRSGRKKTKLNTTQVGSEPVEMTKKMREISNYQKESRNPNYKHSYVEKVSDSGNTPKFDFARNPSLRDKVSPKSVRGGFDHFAHYIEQQTLLDREDSLKAQNANRLQEIKHSMHMQSANASSQSLGNFNYKSAPYNPFEDRFGKANDLWYKEIDVIFYSNVAGVHTFTVNGSMTPDQARLVYSVHRIAELNQWNQTGVVSGLKFISHRARAAVDNDVSWAHQCLFYLKGEAVSIWFDNVMSKKLAKHGVAYYVWMYVNYYK